MEGVPPDRVRVAPRRAQADEWALVLASQGIESRVRAAGHGFALEVAPGEGERATRVLTVYEAENPATRHEAAALWKGDIQAGIAVPALLLAFYFVTGPRDPDVPWFERGAADAARILDGELWRTVTALTLHADLSHVAANAITGAIFLTAACHVLGPGVAVALSLAAGAGGNLVNAWLHGSHHVSVGASTAVFGAVGLLGGAGVMRRLRRGSWGRAALAPIAASLGLLAMLGASGEQVDLWAHLFGLGVGAVLGLAAIAWRPAPAAAPVQRALTAFAALAVLVCWMQAFEVRV